jgi:hypothetical protein
MPGHRKPGPECVFHGTALPDRETHVRRRSHSPAPTSRSWGGSHDPVTSLKIATRQHGQLFGLTSAVPVQASLISADPTVLQHLEYVERAALGSRKYIGDSIQRELGKDFRTVIDAILLGFVSALAVTLISALAGAVLGGGLGAILTDGAATLPCARIGARLGLIIAEQLLFWMGLKYVYEYVKVHLDQMTTKFKNGIDEAWSSNGLPSAIDGASKEIADGAAVFLSLAVQGIVVYLLKSSRTNGIAVALKNLRGSLMFRLCPKFEGWLAESFWRLKLKVEPELKFTVLDEGTAIDPKATSIPEYMKIDVNGRVWEIIRNKEKLIAGKPIGPALKHLHEYAQKGSGAGVGSVSSGTDFPVSPLAGALDKAEASLIFRDPGDFTNLRIGAWTFSIDTTKAVWRVYHLEYKP